MSDGFLNTIPSSINVEETAEENDRVIQVREALASFSPPHYAEVLIYRFLKCLSLAETAEAMGIEVDLVKSTQHRAKEKFRKTFPHLRTLL